METHLLKVKNGKWKVENKKTITEEMAMTYGGMLYFPLKVNIFEEIAIELVEAKFGLKGTTAVMKLLCKIYKENGYYLKWDEEQCTLFANKAGKDISEEEMQGIVRILTEKGFFDLATYQDKQILTSLEIQKVWLEATKRRKRDPAALPYMLVKTEEKKEDKGEDAHNENSNCTQNEGNCIQPADNLPENACNSGQSKVEQSKANESKALPPSIPPKGEGGGKEFFSSFDIPGYAYNKKTHNLECLMLELKQLHITDADEVQKILRLSDYGRLGGTFWKIVHDTNWNKVNSKGGYIISILAKEKRKT